MKFIPFEEARDFVHKLGLKTELEWRKYCKSGNKPENIPSTANGVYYKNWRGWGDWLGTGKDAQYRGGYMPFKEARNFAHSLNLENQKQWQAYCKSGKRPKNFPANPYQVYKTSWKGWGDWLGTDRIANQDIVYYSFDVARKFVHEMSLESRRDWRAFVKSGKKDKMIPANPARTYEEHWIGWGDWLGTGTIAVFNKKFKGFQEARNFARSLRLNSQNEWSEFCKSERRPIDIPSMPSRVYEDE